MIMMSDLPLDLLEEILSRVPATSMKRLRSTCKRWNALFKNQRFTEKHFLKAPKEESMVLMVKEYRLSSITVNLNVAPPSIEFQGGLGLKVSHSNSEQFDIVEVFHCNGLLLCITKDNRAVVWNPCLGETRCIQPKTSYEWYSRFALGYEKNKSGYSYKILMWWDSDDIPLNRVNEFEIYEFSSDSWRVLDNVSLDCFILENIGVSLEGNCYWISYDKKDMYNDFILCFDFTTERFKRLCLPPLVFDEMSLSVVEEQRLSVVSQSDSTSEIWITNKIDNDIEAVLEWSKSFTVDKPICRDLLFFSFSTDEAKKVALCYDRSCEIDRKNKIYIIGDEYYTEILYAESSNDLVQCNRPKLLNYLRRYPFIFSYVPSLVQIQLR